ncbi:MAG: DNA mismatch repair protein MutS [Rikenellaceae bacterium]
MEKKYVETPLMKQYYKIKETHPDAILLFRVGDFYETFGDDAIKASAILGITLTRRANGSASSVELAGFPHHSVDSYLPKLVRAGERVAICEQLEDPKSVKGLVKRGVVELVTPGVVLDQSSLQSKENSFLASVYFGERGVGLALLDVSTGEFICAQGGRGYIDKLIANFSPKELLYQRSRESDFRESFGSRYYSYKLDEWLFCEEVNRERLTRQLGVTSLKGFGVEQMCDAISAAGSILHYLDFTEHRDVAHIRSIGRIDPQEHVWIDKFTQRNLELFSTQGGESANSLATTIDKTLTPMGGRMLRRWIAMPLQSVERLNARLDLVESLTLNIELSSEVSQIVSLIGDLERIASRVATQRATPRELIQLRCGLDAVVQLSVLSTQGDSEPLRVSCQGVEPLDELRQRIAEQIYPDPTSNQIQRGGVIADGVDAELDDLRRTARNGKQVLSEIVERESKRTGITSLKIGFNNVFGYYIEVRNTHKERVPQEWVRKQTLTSGERYITAELKEYEEKILGAEDKMLIIEARIYGELMEYISSYIPSIQRNAQIIARIDVLHSFAQMALQAGYCRPELNDGDAIKIRDGRHPVIERLLPVGEKYIPNNISLDTTTEQIMMITGPNMSGKSALLRQSALIVLMAQIGSFVPAAAASIGVVDKIFTRVGASDNISQGESTFMVEMLESASILNNITSRSLVLLDEIGRGTSTYDGISIAWAMVEYLHCEQGARAKTLFATHYHELNEMEQICPRVKNYNVSVKEVDGKIIFLRRLEQGGTQHSFGIHVARLAGMPGSIVSRADEILRNLEQSYRSSQLGDGGCKAAESTISPTAESGAIQLSMFQLDDPVLIAIRDKINDLDIDNLTPLQALNTLHDIKKLTR